MVFLLLLSKIFLYLHNLQLCVIYTIPQSLLQLFSGNYVIEIDLFSLLQSFHVNFVLLW